MSLRADRLLPIGIKNHDVGVRTDSDRAFSWKQSEDLCRCGRRQLDETIQRNSFLNDTAVVDETHSILDTGSAIRDLAEVVSAKFLLFLETKWTVIGRDDLKIVAAKSLPQLLLIRLVAQWWRHDVLGALKAFLFVIGVIEKQILRAGLRKSRQSQIAGCLNFFECVVATEVDDVHGRVRHF